MYESISAKNETFLVPKNLFPYVLQKLMCL